MVKETPQEIPLLLVKKNAYLGVGLVIPRKEGQGLVVTDYCAILVSEISQDEVEISISRIRNQDFSTIRNPQKQTLKMDKVYGLNDCNLKLLAFFDFHKSGSKPNKVKFLTSFPGVKIIPDEDVKSDEIN